MNTDIPKIMLINKPSGPTSHDIVNMVRRKTGVRRVGHAGTLDPFAEGLLIVLVGRESTKKQQQFLGMDKEYEATFFLGARSSSEDRTGSITPDNTCEPCGRTQVSDVVSSFIGEYDQTPPAFSAKKIKGKKAYELARAGKTVELAPKRVTIKSIEVLEYSWPYVHIRTTVSSGTYIRALARDIGNKLGCGAYCEKLIRTRIGPYKINSCIEIN